MRNQLDSFRFGYWNPAREIFGFTPTLESLYDEATDKAPRRAHSAAVLTPACDIDETEAHYLVSLDIPGVSKDDIRIEVVDDQLTISAEKKLSSEKKAGARHLFERSYGKFYRAFTLAHPVDSDRVEAVYRDGVLRVAIPKSEAAKPKQISVKAEDSSGLFDALLSSGKKDTEKSLN